MKHAEARGEDGVKHAEARGEDGVKPGRRRGGEGGGGHPSLPWGARGTEGAAGELRTLPGGLRGAGGGTPEPPNQKGILRFLSDAFTQRPWSLQVSLVTTKASWSCASWIVNRSSSLPVGAQHTTPSASSAVSSASLVSHRPSFNVTAIALAATPLDIQNWTHSHMPRAQQQFGWPLTPPKSKPTFAPSTTSSSRPRGGFGRGPSVMALDTAAAAAT